MNNPFLNRLIRDDKKDIVHSSAYARTQGAERMGADSTESFARRREIDKSRTVIRRYDDSKIAEESGVRDKNAMKYRKDKGVDGDDERSAGLKQRLNGGDGGSYRYRAGAPDKDNTNKSYHFTEPQSGGKPMTVSPVRRNPGISR